MQHDRISVDPDVMFGKPVIRGTRIPVETVLRKLASGQSVDVIVNAYPHLDPADVYACMAYAADEIANADVYLARAAES